MSNDYNVGLSQGFHDAGVAAVDSVGNIVYASHSERFSHIKSDSRLHPEMLNDMASYIEGPIKYNYYERMWLTNLRRFMVGQPFSSIDYLPRKYKSWSHHLSHAAAAFQTSPFDAAAVVVVDAIGEFETATIWKAWYDNKGNAKYKKLWHRRYPHSLGLFYTAMTRRVGLRPMEDEYVLMGMAAYGDKTKLYGKMRYDFIDPSDTLKLTHNIHTGVDEWMPGAHKEDVAAAAQFITEEILMDIHSLARVLSGLDVVCLGGGVALNCSFNGKLGALWKNAWICPNPGDCGSALGAAALGYGKKLNWVNCFLGKDISVDLDPHEVVKSLDLNRIVGIANGRAEWGPRALGNRSLLADPRDPATKDRVNEIKKRQKYRPFAPAVLSEHANEYFELGVFDYSYMQYAVPATKAKMYPAICHVDGTARVQVVPPGNTNMRKILEAWYAKTNCPILLNTSLNIRGKPIVNTAKDAKKWQEIHGVRVF